MWNELFPNYTCIISERQIFDIFERFSNHELVTMTANAFAEENNSPHESPLKEGSGKHEARYQRHTCI
jgi:hypothetical protein